MTPGEVKRLIEARLGGRLPTSRLSTLMLYELRALQERLELGPVYPWFLLKDTGIDITITDGVGTVPADCIIFSDSHVPRFTKTGSSNVAYLEKRLLMSELDFKYIDTPSATAWPRYYSVQNDKVYVFPLTSGTFRQPYYARQGILNDDFNTFTSSNAWFTHAGNLLAFGVAATLAGSTLKDPDLAQRLDNEFSSTWKQIQFLTIAKETENIRAEANLIPFSEGSYGP